MIREHVIEGHRFLLYFFDMIQTSVAHLYHSALPFSPKTPLLDTYRARETSVEARILQGREPKWTPLIRTMSLPSAGLAVRYSHDGRMLAVGGKNFSQLFWSGTGERLAKSEFSHGMVKSISFSCNDRTLVTASGSTIRIWDVASGSLTTTLVRDHRGISSAEFHPSISHLLVAGYKRGRVYLWDVRNGARTDFKGVGTKGKLCWVRQREQKRIIIGCEDGGMEMWDVDRPQRTQIFPSPWSHGSIRAVASSDDGSLVASGSLEGKLAVYSTHTGEVVHSHEHSNSIWSVAFSPTAPILAFTSEKAVFLWFYATNRIVTFTGHSNDITSVAFSPNGRFIASASWDHTLHIWDIDATHPAPDDIHHSNEINRIHFSNDGQLIVSASADNTVKIWDTLTGTLCTTFKGHTCGIWHAIILLDNVHVVSIDRDETLVVWDWQKHEILLTDTAIAQDHGVFRTLHPYTHTLSPLGFISTHAKSYNSEERIVCCWTVDISVPFSTRVTLVARGLVNTLSSEILRITHRGSTETSNLTLVLECISGKQFSAPWDGPNVVGNIPAELQFVEELEESPFKDIYQLLAGSELPCRQSDGRAWILDEHDRQILWVPPTNRGYAACWYDRHLIIGGGTRRLTLVDFSDVILNDDIEF
jgi:WD40 repeat protein